MKIASIMFKILMVIPVVFTGMACQKESLKKIQTPLNSFSMEFNGNQWVPTIPQGDSCQSTFYCLSGAFDGGADGYRPFYEMYAFQDPNGFDDYRAQNQFRIQLTDVNELGEYILTESYTEYHNYAIFTLNEGISKRYINKSDKELFKVQIDEFINTKSLIFTGISGTFAGVLYNEEDALDSLIISNGKFKFVTGNGAGHCDTFWIK